MIFNPVRKEPRFYKGDSQISLRTSWPTPWRFIPRWLPRPPKQPFLEALAWQQFIALPSFLLPTHSKPHKLICHEQEHLNKWAPFLGCWKLIKAGTAGQVYYSMLYHLFRHSVVFLFFFLCGHPEYWVSNGMLFNGDCKTLKPHYCYGAYFQLSLSYWALCIS